MVHTKQNRLSYLDIILPYVDFAYHILVPSFAPLPEIVVAIGRQAVGSELGLHRSSQRASSPI